MTWHSNSIFSGISRGTIEAFPIPSFTNEERQNSISPYFTWYFFISTVVPFVFGRLMILEYMRFTIFTTPNICTFPSSQYSSLLAKKPLLAVPFITSDRGITFQPLGFTFGSPNISTNRALTNSSSLASCCLRREIRLVSLSNTEEILCCSTTEGKLNGSASNTGLVRCFIVAPWACEAAFSNIFRTW